MRAKRIQLSEAMREHFDFRADQRGKEVLRVSEPVQLYIYRCAGKDGGVVVAATDSNVLRPGLGGIAQYNSTIYQFMVRWADTMNSETEGEVEFLLLCKPPENDGLKEFFASKGGEATLAEIREFQERRLREKLEALPTFDHIKVVED